MLFLQKTAGNSAVATTMKGSAAARGPRAVVQRQPKPGKKSPAPPAWVKQAQAELAKLFPGDPIMSKVVVKDYALLNKTLQKAHFAAWTQSGTEIYLRDPTIDSTKKPLAPGQPEQLMRYVLHHEAEHITQFIGAKGPPATWELMIDYEQKAYANDVIWLNGPGAALIPDPDLFDQFKDQASTNVTDLAAILTIAKGKVGKAREAALHRELITKNLIPKNSDVNPLLLYKQPP